MEKEFDKYKAMSPWRDEKKALDAVEVLSGENGHKTGGKHGTAQI